MVQLTVQLSEDLAARVQPLGVYLSTVLELALTGFRTQAAATASDLVNFLVRQPPPQSVLDYHVSEDRQGRTRRLLALNEVGLLSGEEDEELTELAKLEHVVVQLKAELLEQGLAT